jgi:hypothetical protein
MANIDPKDATTADVRHSPSWHGTFASRAH